MAVIGSLLVLLSLAVFLWACIGLISPEIARLPSRWHSVLVWLGSVALAGLFGVVQDRVNPPPASGPAPPMRAVGEPPISPTQEELEERMERQRRSQEQADEANRRNREEYEARRSSGTAQQAPSRPTAPMAGQASARQWLSRVTGDLGTPMAQIMTQMPNDIQPSRSQSGEDRIFVWRFRDGSEIEMSFRPRAVGQGLELYWVDVND